jgi:hypothetical protein
MANIVDTNITSQIAAIANAAAGNAAGLDVDRLISAINAGLGSANQIGTLTTGTTTGVYKRFSEFDIVKQKTEVVTTGLWSGDSGSLTNAFTSSTQVGLTSAQYYYNVYDYHPLVYSDKAEVQFAVAYGHVDGSGSLSLTNDDNSLLASKATYAQYKSMLLEPTDTRFTVPKSNGTTANINDIYVVNLSRARFREKIDAGNWSMALSGSNGRFKFIDNSGKKFSDENGLTGRVFQVGVGELNLGTQNEATITSLYDTTSGEGFGLFYPDRGIIVLNPRAVGNTVGNVWNEEFQAVAHLAPGGAGATSAPDNVTSTAAEQYYHKRLYYAIKAGKDFEMRRTENISTQHFFVRATNREFNYSNNPTYVKADGTFTETTFKTDPYSYITTVGLYNDSNELIAVAKTSQPVAKSFDKEVLIKVKLSY